MAKRFALFLLLLCTGTAAFGAPRVIALAPSLTEMAFAAGITPVGVSAYSDFPAEAASIEQVANWQGINVERIIALKPDLVLAWRDGNPRRQVEQLRAFGLRVEWIEPTTVAQVAAALRMLKAWSPAPQQAEQAAVKLEQQLAALHKRYDGASHKAVFLQFGQRPLFTASGDTLQNQILKLCGGENIFADSPVPWPQVSREQVLLRNPALIVTGGDAARISAVKAFWQPQLKIPVIAIKEDWFSRPGPRILLAAQQLCRELHPDR
ncbi:vitamin B12 ABC transporter substrate-binding protein BtuF [Erwinia sp. P6884]|uniref:vitamin B12 ABC transporter substrate-binding protein BtuF n=1 Tax=Erwinia sp. P6884 TaxID=3141450 RepID=UPI00319D51FA